MFHVSKTYFPIFAETPSTTTFDLGFWDRVSIPGIHPAVTP